MQAVSLTNNNTERFSYPCQEPAFFAAATCWSKCGKMTMRWLIDRTQKIPTIEKPFGEPPSVIANTSAILQAADISLIFDYS